MKMKMKINLQKLNVCYLSDTPSPIGTYHADVLPLTVNLKRLCPPVATLTDALNTVTLDDMWAGVMDADADPVHHDACLIKSAEIISKVTLRTLCRGGKSNRDGVTVFRQTAYQPVLIRARRELARYSAHIDRAYMIPSVDDGADFLHDSIVLIMDALNRGADMTDADSIHALYTGLSRIVRNQSRHGDSVKRQYMTDADGNSTALSYTESALTDNPSTEYVMKARALLSQLKTSLSPIEYRALCDRVRGYGVTRINGVRVSVDTRTNKGIAEHIGVKPKTVEKYFANIRKKAEKIIVSEQIDGIIYGQDRQVKRVKSVPIIATPTPENQGAPVHIAPSIRAMARLIGCHHSAVARAYRREKDSCYSDGVVCGYTIADMPTDRPTADRPTAPTVNPWADIQGDRVPDYATGDRDNYRYSPRVARRL